MSDEPRMLSVPPAEPHAAGAELRPLEAEEPHPVLHSWRRNVGSPVLLDLAPALRAPPAEIDVLSWNLAIGRAKLPELMKRLHAAGVGVQPERPLVILAQEAFRSDDSVPSLAIGTFHGGRVRGAARRADVVELAHEYQLSLRYAPSMRNGAAPSDRGNAVLATCAISGAHAFSLPFLRQRRVAVAVELAGLPGVGFVSAHFENRGRLALGLRSAVGLGSSRSAQAAELGRRIIETEHGDVVLGADLNTAFGERDPAFLSLIRAGFRSARPKRRWTHTYHGPFRLLLDHVLFHAGFGRIRDLEVERVDEHPRDRSRQIFGSDHHPLLARVALSPSAFTQLGSAQSHPERARA